MPRLLPPFVLLATLMGGAQACSCMAPGPDEAANWRENWKHAQAVVLAEVVAQSSQPATSWLSRDHVLGRSSPWNRRQMLSLIVKHRWKGELADGAAFMVEKVSGAACGYERWEQSTTHLLYLHKGRHWVAGLCGSSHPVVDAASAIQQLDAELARFLGATSVPAPPNAPSR